MAINRHPHIGSLRTALGIPLQAIAGFAPGQHFSIRQRGIPTGPVTQCNRSNLWGQIGHHSLKERRQTLKKVASGCGQGLSVKRQILIPGRQLGVVQFITSQQMISLRERSLEAPAVLSLLVFHVKHTPVQKPPPVRRFTGQQIEAGGIQYQQGQFVGQSRAGPRGFPGNPQHRAASGVALYAQISPQLRACA